MPTVQSRSPSRGSGLPLGPSRRSSTSPPPFSTKSPKGSLPLAITHSAPLLAVRLKGGIRGMPPPPALKRAAISIVVCYVAMQQDAFVDGIILLCVTCDVMKH